MYNPKEINQKAEKFSFFTKKNKKKLSDDDLEIVTTLEKLKFDLDNLYDNLNYITEPLLIDSYIYEINAVFMKYSHYLNLCKERNLIAYDS